MTKDLFDKYIWLVDTIYRTGKITFEEINERWLRSKLSDGKDIPLRTFHNWRIAIEQVFDINIECNRRGGYYYYIENNDYTDMVGFVFNTDNQVSQYWIYYKPSKVNDVYNYLSKKYNTAENENTEYVYVFYNDNRNLKVVLDLMNGAVVYTKLDMKQHETPA